MLDMEISECLSLLSELFPSADLQAAELKVFGDSLRKFLRSDAIDIIRTHRLFNDTARPKFAKITAQLYERMGKNPSAQTREKSLDYIDGIRKQMIDGNPAHSRELQSATKEEIILRFGRGWWIQCSKPAVEGGDPTGERTTVWPERGKHIMREAALSLWRYCDFEVETAQNFAKAIVGTEYEFQDAIESLKGVVA